VASDPRLKNNTNPALTPANNPYSGQTPYRPQNPSMFDGRQWPNNPHNSNIHSAGADNYNNHHFYNYNANGNWAPRNQSNNLTKEITLSSAMNLITQLTRFIFNIHCQYVCLCVCRWLDVCVSVSVCVCVSVSVCVSACLCVCQRVCVCDCFIR